MSNFLSIATVTATLQRILQTAIQLDVPGANVTTVRPDAASGGTPEVGVNIYLYQATPNPAWRNADLRSRRPKGELIKQAQAGLDLYYLFTFYGNDIELEPQRLLGSTVRTLVDQPTLTAEMIQETIQHSSFTFLQDSTLAEQVERVTIVPSFLSTDDLSKIWSVFFQSPYVLSFACQGGAVLIEGEKPSGRALPVRSRQFYATGSQPAIEQISTQEGGNQPIRLESNLLIRGRQLASEVSREQLEAENQRTQRLQSRLQTDDLGSPPLRRWQPQIQIGEAKLTPHRVTETELQLALSQLQPSERQTLRAGVQSLQVLYPMVRTVADIPVDIPANTPANISTNSPTGSANQQETVQQISTNALPFVLCPTVETIRLGRCEREADQILLAELEVTTDVMIGVRQRVFLLLNQRLNEKPAAYIFAAQRRDQDMPTASFTIRNIKAGDYLVRLQIDGAESLLEVEAEQYVRPRIDLRSV
jgi:hypothetical protein